MAIKKDTNEIFIGSKPFMSYVNAVKTQIHKGQKEIILKARGRPILTAVNVSEFIERVNEDIIISSVGIGNSSFMSNDEPSKKITVSTIEIILSKK